MHHTFLDDFTCEKYSVVRQNQLHVYGIRSGRVGFDMMITNKIFQTLFVRVISHLL